MGLIEILIFIVVILLFFITDSRTIHIAAANLLSDYNVSYDKISGNLFSGIEVKNLQYQDQTLLESAKIHWNPIAFIEGTIEITKLDIQGVEANKLLALLGKLPSADSSKSSSSMEVDLLIKEISLSVNPSSFYGTAFTNIHVGTNRLRINRDLTIESDMLYLSLDSALANVEMHGLFDHHDLNIEELRLRNIDPKAITQLVRHLRTVSKPKKRHSKKSKIPLLERIKVKSLVATMKKTTYGPITIDKTKAVVRSLEIDMLHGFDYRAKQAILSTKTNFATTKQVGYIKNSMFYGKGDIITTPYLFAKYHLPLNQKGLHKLPAKLTLNHQGLSVEIDHSIKKLLHLKKSDFNIDLDQVSHRLTYRYLDFYIKIDSQGKGRINYADEVSVENHLLIDFRKKLHPHVHTTYEGRVKLNKIKNIPQEISDNLLEDLEAGYHGDSKELEVNIDSKELVGHLITQGYKEASLTLNSKRKVPLSKLFLSFLPPDLSLATGSLSSRATIDFKEPSLSVVHLKVDSNLLNIEGRMRLAKPYKISYWGDIPRTSLLSSFDPRLKISSFSPFKGSIEVEEKRIGVEFYSGEIAMQVDYLLDKKSLESGLLSVNHQHVFFKGNLEKGMVFSTDIHEVDKFSAMIMRYYDVTLPPLKGEMNVEARMSKDKKIKIRLKSKRLSLLRQGEVQQRFRQLTADLVLSGNTIEISKYGLTVVGNPYIGRIRSHQPSYLRYTNGLLESKAFWLDDQILVSGYYNINTLKGKLKAKSQRFVYKNKDFDLLAKLKLQFNLDHEKIYISGNIKLLGNQIKYEILGSGISEDSDIIIIQDQLKKSKSTLNNIKTYITLENELPLNYLSKDIDIDLINEITLVKDYNKDIRLLGVSRVVGGYYQQEEKKFYLSGSEIYFYGDPKKPILEIKANYQKDKYNIYIYISGSSDDPIINFSSEPYLSQREILSLILFDTAASEGGSGTAVYAMLGGTFAKELMKSLGVNVDHLLLGEGIDDTLSVEVGQKISDNITVIYQHENGKDGVKIKVDHSKNFETDIIIQPPNTSSIEFLYKSD